MPDHFREKRAPREIGPCRVGLHNFFIRTNGEVEACFHGFPILGTSGPTPHVKFGIARRRRPFRRDSRVRKAVPNHLHVAKALKNKVQMGFQRHAEHHAGRNNRITLIGCLCTIRGISQHKLLFDNRAHRAPPTPTSARNFFEIDHRAVAGRDARSGG
jgi:hypothetical protein